MMITFLLPEQINAPGAIPLGCIIYPYHPLGLETLLSSWEDTRPEHEADSWLCSTVPQIVSCSTDAPGFDAEA
jgi:hypothetical protein